ncbi:MAG TPA: FAD-dependent oxidoreductase [Aggregatilinea sp.]|jgi:thioredoxin reductase (NADPH)|uniref:FAD-dependent oxidoreductase n=1 Tax=Aggregatilinea sp. TaxID=2806333 RepID=UPI002B5865F3|nr:FAD-dependent oxidoreductase [Aggregatilinea sp.]HML23823.1 FAD-dependent oxidoreductase [Aggregatilinea sp.]
MTDAANESIGAPLETIRMYGAAWCPDCRRAKSFFGEQRVHYEYIDIEQFPESVAEVERINHGMRSIPTILFPDGSILVEPSDEELAAKLDLHLEASKDFYDIIIIGSGPAGLTAGIYTSREGLSTLVIEKSGVGGQVGLTRQMDNFPGFDKGVSGADLADRLRRQAERFGVEILQAQKVVAIDDDGAYRIVRTASGRDYCANAVLIATGSHYKRLGVRGEAKLIGINVHFCATCDAPFYKGKEVYVFGGGNSGFQEALHICQFADKVTILEYDYEAHASLALQQKVHDCAAIEIMTGQQVKELLVTPDRKLDGVRLVDRRTGEERIDHPDGVFVLIGMEPNCEPFKDRIETDQWGFIVTKPTLETSMPGVFAAGDIRAGSTKQAASAAGEGATAALMMRQYLSQLVKV